MAVKQSNSLSTDNLKRKRRINAESKRLISLFDDSDLNQFDLIREQVQQLAWLNVHIAELQEKINHFGTLVAYDNGGGQSGVRTNPDVKTLTDFQKLANSIVKNLEELVPANKKSGFASLLSKVLTDLGDSDSPGVAEG